MIIEILLLQISFSAVLALLLSSLFGSLSPWIAGISLIFGAIGAVLLVTFDFRQPPHPSSEGTWKRSPFRWHALSDLSWVLFAFLGFIVFRHLTYLFYFSEGWWKTLHPNNYGDLPLHISYIRFFSAGNAFPPANPFFMSEALRYPIGMDLFNALWEVLGAPTTSHLFLVGVVGFLLIFATLYLWSGAWAWAAIFMNGGWLAWNLWSVDGGVNAASQIAWKNLFLSVLLTQRGFLFALPAGVLVLLAVYQITFKDQKLSRQQGLIYGWLWGVLAFFHLHAFVAVSLLSGLWILLRKKWQNAIFLLVVAVFVGTPFVIYSTGFLQKASILRWHLGWTLAEGESLFLYWWKNFGPWTLLLLIFVYETLRGVLREWRVYYFSVLFLMLSTQVISFAPWEWDNIKLILWYYLAALPLIQPWVEARLKPWVRDVVLVSLFFSGAVALSLSLRSDWKGMELFKQAEINVVDQVIGKLPPNAVVATADSFQHPVSFMGRGIAIGYAGHLWSHGIDAHEVRDAVDRIFKGEADWQILVRRLGITHIYWGHREKEKYKGGIMPWMDYDNLSPTSEVGIYDLQSIFQ